MNNTEGTWCFWAPEMCGASNDGAAFNAYAADAWAAGATLWCFLYGTVPFFRLDALSLLKLVVKRVIDALARLYCVGELFYVVLLHLTDVKQAVVCTTNTLCASTSPTPHCPMLTANCFSSTNPMDMFTAIVQDPAPIHHEVRNTTLPQQAVVGRTWEVAADSEQHFWI